MPSGIRTLKALVLQVFIPPPPVRGILQELILKSVSHEHISEPHDADRNTETQAPMYSCVSCILYKDAISSNGHQSHYGHGG